ncbi:GNAT family N-acetyltransferase [Sphingosinicella terrae]|uniref:GNAT family N-acetyltransferase n=1 Tax=Sphingosinicella terrae TaxID=2172047 RepID=UPI002547D968|nr:GNAT family N-acetyltransferase [Sphingosinicella terrae]
MRVGTRTLWTLRRRLVRRRVRLDEALDGMPPALPCLSPEADGYLVTGVPAVHADAMSAPGDLALFVRQAYVRSYARLDLDFDTYLAGFSAKSRSTLKRKLRKLAEQSGGSLDLRVYRRPDELEEFHRQARALSALTYQERRLGAGLPDGEAAVAEMQSLARRDQVRAWLLFVDRRPVSYLYAPAEGETLIYAHLGYDPGFAAFSPGTVLQLEAMRLLMDEHRFRLFDFTEGDGQHKRQFATDSLDCVDLLLLRRNPTNLALGHALNLFDRGVATAKHLFAAWGGDALRRRLRR